MAIQRTVSVPYGTGSVQKLLPAAPPEAFKTYEVRAPISTHFRAALCEEIECAEHMNGWVSAFDESDPDQVAQANYVRNFSGRHFTEHRGMRVPSVDGAGHKIVLDAAGPLTVFQFPAGQMCFRADDHRVPLEREPLYVVSDGDWRRSRVIRHHANGDDWVDDIGEYMDKVADDKSKG